jgi:hypothetical protein
MYPGMRNTAKQRPDSNRTPRAVPPAAIQSRAYVRYEVRHRWRECSGATITEWQLCRPRCWWSAVTRPLGILLVLFAVLWPPFLVAQGWSRLGVVFAVGDASVVFLGFELIAAGQRRWLS